MSPKKTATSQTSRASLARRLASLDNEIVARLNERAQITREYDSLHGNASKTATRDAAKDETMAARLAWDQEAIDKAATRSRGPLSEDCVRDIFRSLTSGARQLTHPIRVAYLGPAYTYSHLAALRYFGGECEFLPVNTIPSVFEEVVQQHADFGVVPLENSTDGRVSDTLDMFLKVPVKICGEVKLKIEHCLLARCPRAAITQVFSKPQAMSQCRGWLAKHLPQAATTPTTSTVAAAQYAAENEGAAAIASREAAARYGLQVIDAAIQDHPHNLTRFAVIGHHISNRSGQDKTAFLFAIPHEPGALADIMTIFKRQRLNMTWIESYPDPEMPEAYLFFVEAQGHPSLPRMKQAIEALRKKTSRLELLGSYPADQVELPHHPLPHPAASS